MARSRARGITPSLTNQYIHAPLAEPHLQIRLVRLLRASETNAPIFCVLETFFPDVAPEYEALSYTWGRPDEYGHKVFINERPFAVTLNLEDALRRLRDRSHDRWMWIDVLCINMQDLHERGAQVSVMRTIFSLAMQVTVWLGEPSLANRPAIAALKDFDVWTKYTALADLKGLGEQVIQRLAAEQLHSWPELEPDLLEQTNLYASNFNHSWFTRVWAIQEYVLAKRVVFQWGSDILDAVVLADNVDCIMNALSLLTKVEKQQQEMHAIRKHLRGFRYLNWVKRTWNKSAEDSVAFGYVVATAQELHASDPRDHVFGLLALAPSSLRHSYWPDYTISIDEVYLRLAVAMSLTTRVEALFDLIENKYLTDGKIPIPHWLPGWIDELSLQVSDLLQKSSMINGTLQKAVVECLKILAIDEKSEYQEVHLSQPEKTVYAKILQRNSSLLRSVLSQVNSTKAPALFTLDTAPRTLNSVFDELSDSDYSPVSSSAEKTSLMADEIAAHLLSHNFLRRLFSAAQKLESRDDNLELFLRPCIKHLGHELDTMASDFEESMAARELKRHAPFIARALIARIRRFDVDEDPELKIQRASKNARLLDEQTSRHNSRLHDDFSDVKQRSANLLNRPDNGDGTRSPLPWEPLQQDLPMAALDKVKEFMRSESAFMPFLHLVQQMVYSGPVEIIGSEVSHLIQAETANWSTGSAEETTSYEFVTSLHNEASIVGDNIDYKQFWNMLTISGTAKSCHATNCESYLKWAWPNTSHYLLRALSRVGKPEVSGKYTLD